MFIVHKKINVAVLGGAFDPPTNGHLQLATELVQANGVDEVRAGGVDERGIA